MHLFSDSLYSFSYLRTDEEVGKVGKDVDLVEGRVKELLGMLTVIAGGDEIVPGVIIVVKGQVAVGKDVSWDMLVVVNAMTVEKVDIDFSVGVEVFKTGTTALVAVETSCVDISGSVEVLEIVVGIEVVCVDTSGVV